MAHKPKPILRKITKTGRYTYYVVVPKEFMDELHWKERQKVKVQVFKKGILVKDWKRSGV